MDLVDLIDNEQFINACFDELAMYLLERGSKDLVELAVPDYGLEKNDHPRELCGRVLYEEWIALPGTSKDEDGMKFQAVSRS